MKAARLETILGMIIAASSLGARGLVCGPCPQSSPQVIPLLPPSSDGGPGGEVDVEAACARLCPQAIQCEATTLPLEGGTMPAIECTEPPDCSAGRRPEGLSEAAFAAGGATPAGWLARAAFLEAASVDAFRALGRDLHALGAPRRLRRAASRAARDERRHARRMRSLARRHGAVVPAPEVRPPTAAPTLAKVAAHNAAEGCVRETFGALVARFQAASAGDRELASAMARIAADEARHAALAWEIDAWARRRLGPEERERLDRAREDAVRELFSAALRPAPAALIRSIGLPDRPTAERLARRLAEALGLTPRA